jgi:hypothetical protein
MVSKKAKQVLYLLIKYALTPDFSLGKDGKASLALALTL